MEASILLFDKFETLDVFGPVEILGRLRDNFTVRFYSENGGIVTSAHEVPVMTIQMNMMPVKNFLILVPGGIGTRKELDNERLIGIIRDKSTEADYILSVCTGSVLLAKAGILSGKRATTNKRVYNWVIQYGKDVDWIKKARWVKDGNIYTSSGVSAGIDMTLSFIGDILGQETADKQSIEIEYIRNKDPDNDPFAGIY